MEPEISYYIVGTLPVKYIRDVEREIFFVKKFDRKTGCFINGGE